MKLFSTIEHDALHSLAKRKHPNCLTWYVVGSYPTVCLLCNKTMTYDVAYEHGIMHLRGHNLLPFI